MPRHIGADSRPALVVQRSCNDGLDVSLELQPPKSMAGSKSLNPLNYNWLTGIGNIFLFYDEAGFRLITTNAGHCLPSIFSLHILLTVSIDAYVYSK